MGRGRKLALLVAACLVVLAILAWLNRPRDEPTRATVGDAVRSFRENGDSQSRETSPKEPALGVYRYATRGSESANSPFFDATHDYDGVSTITLTAGRCGQRERWQVLAGRWTEAEACASPGGEVSASVTEFHEFFNTAQEDSFRCRAAGSSRTPDLQPGMRFSTFCRSRDSSISTSSRVVGFETVSVDGEALDALHLRSRSVLEGPSSGITTRDEWRRRSDALLLRRSSEGQADTSKGGGTHYSERYTIELLSTTPKR
jgi:hypothetical protein